MVTADTHALHISYVQLNLELQQNSTPLKQVGGFCLAPRRDTLESNQPRWPTTGACFPYLKAEEKTELVKKNTKKIFNPRVNSNKLTELKIRLINVWTLYFWKNVEAFG